MARGAFNLSGVIMKKGFLLILMSTLLASCINAEEILLKCDEFERMYDSVAGDSFCTVSGFSVSHNQNVKIQKYIRANMTKFMKFYDSRLLYLPFKLFDVFNNLKTLDVSFTEILDVPRSTFAAANTLAFLNMSNNNITQITTSVFMGASGLLRLDLSHNFIEEINENAFQGLDSLDRLQLSYNRIKVLHKNLFVENSYMETLVVDNNFIQFIDPELFSTLQRIRDVNLANNRLHNFHPNTFDAAYGLETLVLSYNNLSEFHLCNKSILLQLRVDHNHLTSVSINATKTVRAEHNNISEINMVNTIFLEDLVVSNNNITNLSNITQLTGLLYLDLSYNRIGALNTTTFHKLKRLRELYLRATGIPQLTYGMFSKLTNLEVLDLSYNNLTELNLKVFIPYLAKLKSLFIDGNNLTEIHGSRTISFGFQNLMKLGISDNRFNCSYLHSLLMPPYLSPTVALHIEPIAGNEESSHIRDITCISNVNESLNSAKQELSEMSQLQLLMRQSMQTMRLHEKKLELYLLVMKIVMIGLLCLLVGALIGVISLRYKKLRHRPNYFSERAGGSIVFRSTNTVNTEH